jgi:hypothetical protein
MLQKSSNTNSEHKFSLFTKNQFQLLSEKERLQAFREGRAGWSLMLVGLKEDTVNWQQVFPEEYKLITKYISNYAEGLCNDTDYHSRAGLTEQDISLMKTRAFHIRLAVITTGASYKTISNIYESVYVAAKELAPNLAKMESKFTPHIFLYIFPYSDNFLNVFKEYSHKVSKVIKAVENSLGEDDVLIFAVWRALLHEIQSKKQEKTTYQKPIFANPLANTQGFIKTASDRLNKATIESFMPGAMKTGTVLLKTLEPLEASGITPSTEYFAAYVVKSNKNDLTGLIGFKSNPSEAIWDLLQKNGALAVKAQFALWARYYAATDGEHGNPIALSINQFCNDLGFKKHNCAHRKKNKQAAKEVFELLTSLELQVIYRPLNGKSAIRLSGPIWQRYAEIEKTNNYSDLFDESKVMNIGKLWEPITLVYSPGVFFHNKEWRENNRYIGYVCANLLKLGCDNKDKWAVLIGGYLTISARMNGYRPIKRKISTLLDATGLISIYQKHRRPGQMEDILIKALDRLVEVDVIKSWDYTNETADEDSEIRTAWSKVEFEKVIEVAWTDPLQEQEQRLTMQQRQKIKRKANKREK